MHILLSLPTMNPDKPPLFGILSKRRCYHIPEINDDMIVGLPKAPKTLSQSQCKKMGKLADGWIKILFKYKYVLSEAGSDYRYLLKTNLCPYTGGRLLQKMTFIWGPTPAHQQLSGWKEQLPMPVAISQTGYKFRGNEYLLPFYGSGRTLPDTDFLDKHLPQEADSLTRKQSSADGGFELAGIRNGSWVRFANVDMTGSSKQFTAHLAGLSSKGKKLENVRSINGPLIGTKYNSVVQIKIEFVKIKSRSYFKN
ncbi:hypothetical protein FQR65_LT15425 [Abscondita terminalis]|nr:hypothetical protein FQR65_LT15425 [Abscondita terminalis]